MSTILSGGIPAPRCLPVRRDLPRTFAIVSLLVGVVLSSGAVRAEGEGASEAGAIGAAEPGAFLSREDVRDWIRRTSVERGLDRHRVAGLFARLETR